MTKNIVQILALVIIVAFGLILGERYPARFQGYYRSPPAGFSVYLLANERVTNGESPYIGSELSPYKYSPGALALFNVLPKDPPKAWLIFSTFSILLFCIALGLGAKYHQPKSLIWLIFGLAISWKGVLETLDYGQLELLIFALAVFAGALRIRQPLLCGLIAGSLPWFKLPWVILLFPLILTPLESLNAPGRKPRRIRLVISGYLFASFIWGAAVPSLVFGTYKSMELTRQWIDLLIGQQQLQMSSDINQSFWMSSQRWLLTLFGFEWIMLGIGIVAIAGGLILGSLTSKTLKSPPNREVFAWLTPWLIATQLLNPLSWRWGSALMVGAPFAIAGMHATVGRTIVRTILIVVAVGLWFLQLNPVVKMLGYHHWTDFHGYGVVTLYWLALLMLSLQPADSPFLSDLNKVV